MPNTDSPYGGTLPPSTDVGPAPVPTTTVPAPAPVDTGLAFTGGDLIGVLVVVAFLLAVIGTTLITWGRERSHRDDLVIPGYGGTPYTSSEVSDGVGA